MEKIPYGKSNFEQIKDGNYLFVDKTKYIEMLEEENSTYQFFIRPRRFGKSLFVSILENYYDINKKDKFDYLFGDLYIGKNPTKEKNSYLVLKLSFASIVTNETRERLIETFDFEVENNAKYFIRKYKKILKIDILPKEVKGSEAVIKFIVKKAYEAGQKIMVLIDEYDNFANDIVGKGKDDLYYDLIQSEGYVRVFYKALKDGTAECISRIFITGVSPIMLDDLTSGFNITRNFSIVQYLNEMMGLTENEVREVIKRVEADKVLPMELLIIIMRRYFNGYLFNAEAENRVYNTDMVLYFLDLLTREGKVPENILDQNVKTDYKKLQQMAFSFKDEELLDKLIKEGEVMSTLVDRFSLEHMYSKRENFISLLFYIGMLTIKKRTANYVTFQIPNYAIKTIYWEYFQKKVEGVSKIKIDELANVMDKFRMRGDVKPFIDYAMNILEKLSNRDLQKFDEKYIKAVLLTLINMDGIFLIESEYECEKGYVDVLLTKDARWGEFVNYEWVIELKYLKESDKNRLEAVKKEGLEQLEKYINEKVKGRVKIENLKKVLVIVIGKNEAVVVS